MVQKNADTEATSSKPVPNAEDLEGLKQLMSAGKRHLICHELQSALDCFVGLCEQLANFYGEVGDECAEAYLYYGKTLLELGRSENGIFGNAMEAEETEEEEEESTEENGKDAAAVSGEIAEVRQQNTAENSSVTRKTDEQDSTGVSSNASEMVDDQQRNIVTEENDKNVAVGDEIIAVVSSSTTNASPSSSNVEAVNTDVVDETTEEDEEAGEEVTNMQLAWEMFELTAFICYRIIKREGKKMKEAKAMLAESKYGLAQIGLETEHYVDAKNDFTDCLEYYKDVLEDPADRRIAEIHYNIALSLSFDKKFEDAIGQYKLAVDVLQTRISNLEKKLRDSEDRGGKEKASSEQEDLKKEIDELKDLVLSDMMAKIEDAEESKSLAEKSIQLIKEKTKEMFNSMNSNGFDKGFEEGFESSMDGAKVNDISDKLRSLKRKSDDDENRETKKTKTEKQDMNGKEETKVVLKASES